MRTLFGALLLCLSLNSCQDNESENQEFTGNESTYGLSQASDYPVSGTVTIKEKTDGSALILISLDGTEGSIKHPVHLHLGDISTPDANISALLNPISGKTGISETHLTALADESRITYADLITLNACIKVHLSDAGTDKNIILAGGNIGSASITDSSSGRLGVRVCKSE